MRLSYVNIIFVRAGMSELADEADSKSVDGNIVHVPVGKASFSEEALQENFNALMDAIVKAKPSALKGQYLRSITLTSTMGPGVKVSVAKF